MNAESTRTVEGNENRVPGIALDYSAKVPEEQTAGTVLDCTVLGVAALLPVILDIGRLGFYADDWGNIGRFQSNHDATILEHFHRLYSLPGTRGRPAMDLYLAVLYRLFGLHPFAYHLTNALVLASAAWLFYHCLRLVSRQRFVALTVPLIFLLLPNYSSARLVPCTSMIGLSLAFFFLNLYSLLKATSKAKFRAVWACLSVVAVLISGLLYEMLLPLFALNLVVAALQPGKPAGERLKRQWLTLLFAANASALLSVAVFKMLTATRPHGVASVRSVLVEAIAIHFYKLGLRLPVIVAKAIFLYGSPQLSVLGLLFGIFVFFYLLRLREASEATKLNTGICLIAFGSLTFVFALSIFVATGGATGFTATGFENRTAIGISLGLAFIFAGASISVAGLVRNRHTLIAALVISLLCSSELVVTSSIASFWAAAAQRQELVLNSIRHDLKTLPPHSALILDGVCPYIGPGIVFEGHQDMGGPCKRSTVTRVYGVM